MDVVAAGQAGLAASPDLLTLFDHITDFHANRREVAVERLDAEAVVDNDAVAVNAQIIGMDDDASLRGGDRHIGGDRKIEPEMDLLVHFLALVEIRAGVRELRLNG